MTSPKLSYEDVLRRASEISRVDIKDPDLGSPLGDKLPVDSFVAIQLVSYLQEHGIDVNVDFFLNQITTFGDLKFKVDDQKRGKPFIDHWDWNEEQELPDLATTLKPYWTDREPVKVSNSEIKTPNLNLQTEVHHILLTGATGFLGSHLLATLLDETPHTVYCIVRCESVEAGGSRVKDQLVFQGLWKDKYEERLIVIVGDVSKPHLGMTPDAFSQVAARITGIFHAAAINNLALPYRALKAANTTSTLTLLTLAALGSALRKWSVSTPLYYISSTETAVLDGPRLGENLPISEVSQIGGYGQSKWVSERLVERAYQRWRVPAHIYRPGAITGHSVSGISTRKGFIHAVLLGLIQLQSVPTGALSYEVDMVPVDFVSKAVMELSFSCPPRAEIFTLTHPNPPVLRDLLDQFPAFNLNLRTISDYLTWFTEVDQLAFRSRSAPLRSFRSLFVDHFPPLNSYVSPKSNNMLSSVDVTCPPISPEVIRAYLNFLIHAKSSSAFVPERESCVRDCQVNCIIL